jgi:hypothetical protein
MKYRFVFLCVWLGLGPACDLVNKPTKTAHGQLYQSGDSRYDAYFTTVHQEQVASSNWPEESKNARKPIIAALSLKANASNPTIFSATRDKKGDASLAHAVDETVSAERELAKKLSSAAERLDELLKKGEELKKQTVEDRRNMAADKADDKKVAQKDEVKNEMSAAVDAVDSMATDAKKGAKEAEELATKLRGTWTGREDEEPLGTSDEKKDADKDKKDEKKDADKDKKDEKKKPSKKPKPEKPENKQEKPDGVAATPKKPAATPAAPADKAAPKPADKGSDEVFNP